MAIEERLALVDVKLTHLKVQRDRDTYVRALAELCCQAADAERCTVYLVDRVRQEVWSRIALQTSIRIRLPIGSGLAGHAAATGETINVPDAYADPRFDSRVDRESGFRTSNVLVVPVWGADDPAVVAVIQVLNKRGDGAFEWPDQMVLERIAITVAPVLEQLSMMELAS